ncbi:MAG: flagellar motor switch protein FliM [Oscillospiraceae bacterium]|nr:flagellar motor switch protein FliM [Oscillospiraceae bacterium]
MSDVLSQSEIDNLLKSLTQGDFSDEEESPAEVKVKKYDFRTANKFTKEQVKTLHNVYSTFSHLLSTYLSGTLRTSCQVEVLSAEEQTYSEYTNSLQVPLILAIVDMPPLDGSTLIEISPSIAYGILNRLLGGKGGDLETSKTFTDIDIALMERVIHQILKQIDNAWSRIAQTKSKLNRIETSPQFAQIVAYNEPTVIITISVKIGDEVDGFINICIPFVAIDPINSLMENSMWVSSKKIKHEPENEANIRERLKRAKFNITANFNSMPISLQEVVSLGVGDVLKLDHRVGDGLLIDIAGMPKFRGKLGVFENKYAVKLAEKIEEDRDDE